jgi:quinol-cytochrome oxidoreductase complex cytochrome b subunit
MRNSQSGNAPPGYALRAMHCAAFAFFALLAFAYLRGFVFQTFVFSRFAVFAVFALS